MEKPIIAPLFGDTAAIAARFAQSEATLATLRSRGGGPRYFKRGSRVYYMFDDVQRWLEAGAHLSTSED